MRAARCVYRPAPGQHHYFAQLSAGDVLTPPETAIRIACDYSLVVSCFDVGIKRVCGGHVCEVRAARCIYGPLLGQRDYFA